MAYQTTDACGRLWETKLTTNDSTPVDGAEKLGAIRILGDGRKFRYTRMTGGAGSLGLVLMPGTKVSITDATSASGTGPDGASTTIITDSDASWTTNDYINWYYQTATSMTGSTEPIKVVGNAATTLTLEKSIGTSLAAGGTDDGEILAGTAAGIASTAGDLDVATVGVCISTLTQNYYGWVQVAGPAAVLSDAITEGESICPGGGTAGYAIAADTDADNTIIGVCIAASGSAEYTFADLRIA